MCKTYDINYRDQTVSSLTAWLDQQSKSLVLLMAASYLRLARTSQRSGNNGDNGDGSHDGHPGNNEDMKIIMNAHGSFLPEACENKTIFR